MDINTLKNKIEQFLEDNALEVLESEGHKLHTLPNKVARNFLQEFSAPITNILYNNEDSLNNEDFKNIQKILIQAQIIKSRYDKFEIVVKKVANRIKSNKVELVTEEELNEGVKLIFNNEIPANEFYLNEEFLYQNFIKTYCTNAAINSGFFQQNSEISLEQLSQHPRISQHVKKTAFDQMCLLVFGHHPEQYDIMRKLEEIDINHKINNLMDIKLKKNQVLFGYVDMNPLTVPKFPRFAAILSSHEGIGCSVEEVFHLHQVLKIQAVVAGVEVFVQVPVWYGVVISKIDPSSHKPLDLNSILDEAAQMVQEDPTLSKNISKIKEDQLLVNSYFKVFTQLATATNDNYSQVLKQLKQQALQGDKNASH
jgi:hypothetical protein